VSAGHRLRNHLIVVDDTDLVAAYQAGASARELADQFGVSTKTVLNRLARAGVDRRRRGAPQLLTRLDDRSWLAAQYGHAHRSAAELAAELGCSETSVLEALHRHGITVRRRGGGNRLAPMPAQFRDPTWLRERYDAGASIRSIAAEVGVSGSAVAKALRRADIPRRPVGNTRPQRVAPLEARVTPSGSRRSRLRSGALGVLADGTEYFVALGQLEVVDGGTRVLCHLCGQPFRLLSTTHLRGHGWTPAQYREAFGLNRGAPLCAPSVSEQRRVAGYERYADPRVRAGLAIGQQMVRSGEALRLAHVAMPPGTARMQRRLRALDVTQDSRQYRHDEALRRRGERVRELGFDTERAYVRDRYVRRGWGIARIKAELRVGSGVVEHLLDAARIPRRPPGGSR